MDESKGPAYDCGKSYPMMTPESMLAIYDDPQVRAALAEIGSRAGIARVETVSEIGEAEKFLAKERFSVIFCQYHQNAENGVQFVKRLRDAGDRTPALVVSRVPDSKALIETLGIASAEFLKMPFSLAELKSALEKACSELPKEEKAGSVF